MTKESNHELQNRISLLYIEALTSFRNTINDAKDREKVPLSPVNDKKNKIVRGKSEQKMKNNEKI